MFFLLGTSPRCPLRESFLHASLPRSLDQLQQAEMYDVFKQSLALPSSLILQGRQLLPAKPASSTSAQRVRPAPQFNPPFQA